MVINTENSIATVFGSVQFRMQGLNGTLANHAEQDQT